MYASIREISISVLPVAGVGICPRFDGTGALRVELHSRVGLFHKAGRDRVAFEKQLSRVGDLALRSVWNDHKWSWRPCCRSRAHCMLLSRFADCCRTSFAPSTLSIGTAMKWSPTRQLRVIEPATVVGLVRWFCMFCDIFCKYYKV